MKNSRISAKERGLIKGALRRVFSRSDLRKTAVDKSLVKNYHDPLRIRVKRWSICPECQEYIPTYKMQVDHISPVIKLTESLDDISWDQLVDRLWCEEDNLVAICTECHKVKSKNENKERRRLKKEGKK